MAMNARLLWFAARGRANEPVVTFGSNIRAELQAKHFLCESIFLAPVANESAGTADDRLPCVCVCVCNRGEANNGEFKSFG